MGSHRLTWHDADGEKLELCIPVSDLVGMYVVNRIDDYPAHAMQVEPWSTGQVLSIDNECKKHFGRGVLRVPFKKEGVAIYGFHTVEAMRHCVRCFDFLRLLHLVSHERP